MFAVSQKFARSRNVALKKTFLKFSLSFQSSAGQQKIKDDTCGNSAVGFSVNSLKEYFVLPWEFQGAFHRGNDVEDLSC